MALSEFKANIIKETGYQSAIVKGFDVEIEERDWRGYRATIRLMFENDSDAMLFIAEVSDTSLSELKTQIMASINDLPTAKQLINGYRAGRVSECSDRDADPWDSIRLDDEDIKGSESVQLQSENQKTARDGLSLNAARVYNTIVDLYATLVYTRPIKLSWIVNNTQLSEGIVYNIVVELDFKGLVHLTVNDNVYLLVANDVILTDVDQYGAGANFKALFKSRTYSTNKVKEHFKFTPEIEAARAKAANSSRLVDVYNYIIRHTYKDNDLINCMPSYDLGIAAIAYRDSVFKLVELGLIKEGNRQGVGAIMYGNESKGLLYGALFFSFSDYYKHFHLEYIK